MIRSPFGGLLALVGAFALSLGLASAQVIFSDDFTAADGTVLAGRVPPVGQAWTQSAGTALTIQSGGLSTSGTAPTVFGQFSQPFNGTVRLAKMTIDFTQLTHGGGYAGVSLYDGGSERIFVGDLSGTNASIGVELASGGQVWATPITANGVVTLLYDSGTGRTILYSGSDAKGAPLGTLQGPVGLNFDRIRIQNSNGDSLTLNSVKVEMVAQGPVSIDTFAPDLAIALSSQAQGLLWTTTFADQVAITPGIGSVATSGFQGLPSVLGDRNYLLTATDSSTGNTGTASTTVRTVAGGVSTYRYVRYTTRKIRNAAATTWTQLADFQFFKAGVEVHPIAVTNPGGANPSANEDFNKLIDDTISTKWIDYNIAPVIFDFGTPTAFDSYAMNTANDAPERDPVRWTLEGSDNGSTWTLIDNVTAFDYPTPSTRLTPTNTIPLPGATLYPYLKVIPNATTAVSGEPVVFTYQALGAQTLTLNDGTNSTTLTPSGSSTVVHPTKNTTYTVTAATAGGLTTVYTTTVNLVTPAITSIAYANFDASGNELSLTGAAQTLDVYPTIPQPGDFKRLRLTATNNYEAGTAWFRKRQNVGQGFDTTFGMQITRTDNGIGADGMAFVVQNAPEGSNLTIGYPEQGLQTNALSVAFDTFVNGTEQSAATLRVASAGTELALIDLSKITGVTLSGTAALLDATGQGAPYPVRVVYTPGALSVYFEGILVADRLAVDLTTLGAVDSTGSAYVGFAARTGGLAENHDITSWTLTTGATATLPLKIVASSYNFTNSQVTLTWQSNASKTYRITASPDLVNWTTVLKSGIAGAGGQTTSTATFTSGAKQFFRVEEQ